MIEPMVLGTEAELSALFEESSQRPAFLFKHSLTCPISTAAWHRYLEFVEAHAGDARFAVIEVQNQRDLSKLVEERTGVHHESPQALLLEDGRVRWHASHGSITLASLDAALRAEVD